MRYIGKDDRFTYLKCRACKRISAYPVSEFENKKNGTCDGCATPFKHIWFYPLKITFLISWLPPIFMALFFAILIVIMFSPSLMCQYQFNRFVTTSNSLLISIIIPILASVFSVFLSALFMQKGKENVIKTLSWLLLMAECVALILVLNNIIETQYCSLEIMNPDTNEIQQYYGSAKGTYASGEGRLFDHQGNLIYYGGFENNLYNGYGKKYEQINAIHNIDSFGAYQCVYEGYFKDGLPSGQGKEYRFDAEYTFEKEAEKSQYLYYEGEFLAGEYCGYGTWYGIDEKYQGSFFKGEKNGYGVYWKLDSGSSKVHRKEGLFNNGKSNGKGVEYYPNGNVKFEGDYINNQFSSGTLYFENGNIEYEGSFSNGYNGDATLYWENGNIRYKGDFKEGKRHGMGTSYRKDGTKEYDGRWEENTYSGHGTLYFEDGIIPQYKGTWRNGRYNSEGTEYYETGEKRFKGGWENGTLNGQGAWFWENGNAYYEGEYNEGSIEGQGTTHREDGTLDYIGEFFDGKRHGQGTSYWDNGNIQYSGEWSNGQYYGYGKEYDKQGNLLHEGYFKDGQYISDSENTVQE